MRRLGKLAVNSHQIVPTILTSLRFVSAVIIGACLIIDVATMIRSAGSLFISDPKLTDNSAISGEMATTVTFLVSRKRRIRFAGYRQTRFFSFWRALRFSR